MKRISQNADALPVLLWEEGERSNQLVLRKQKHIFHVYSYFLYAIVLINEDSFSII